MTNLSFFRYREEYRKFANSHPDRVPENVRKYLNGEISSLEGDGPEDAGAVPAIGMDMDKEGDKKDKSNKE